MNNVLDKIKENKVNYDQVLSNCLIENIGELIDYRDRFLVVIPVRGREHFLPALIDSFFDAGDIRVIIIVVEHSALPLHRQTCKNKGIGYIHIRTRIDEPFNKCLCYNVGVFLAPPTEYIIFHDLDCLIQAPFFDNIDACIDVNEARAMQTFNGRRVLYCSPMITEQILNKNINVNELCISSNGIKVGDKGAPGGSILVAYDLFFKIGGYDPELFYSYSPEDAFFWQKIELFEKVYSCETNEVFHLNHPTSVNSNPDLPRLVKLMKEFHDLPLDHKMEIITYKQSLIKQYE